ncbi:MAG: GNAT family N-acetyltransferase [Janthinobacterium lividum]
MTKTAVTIEPFDLAGAPEGDYRALNHFSNLIQSETLPEDPPTPLSETIAAMQNIPSFISVFAWAAWNQNRSEVVGAGYVSILNTEENKHLVWFDVNVLPEHRRQGIGHRLLALLVDVPQREGRRLMMVGTHGRVPAGDAFLTRLGGERAMESHTNQLVLTDVDRDLLTQWMTPESNSRFEMKFWEGPHPEDQLAAMAALFEVMNTAPRDKMDMEDMHFTPEHMRQMEQQMLAGGTIRWTVSVRESTEDKFAGFTEVYWNPNRPQIVSQGGTGVFPEYRGHGLGRRLKAAMLDKVLRERPEVLYVRTGNADSNGPMLRINQALGFRPYLSRTEWQVDTSKVLAYLDRSTDV